MKRRAFFGGLAAAVGAVFGTRRAEAATDSLAPCSFCGKMTQRPFGNDLRPACGSCFDRHAVPYRRFKPGDRVALVPGGLEMRVVAASGGLVLLAWPGPSERASWFPASCVRRVG